MENDFEKKSGNGAPTKSDGQQNPGNSTPIGLNFQMIMTPPGIMLIVNIVLLFLTWCIIAGWRDANKRSWLVYGSIDFFLFSALLPWILLLIIAVLLVFGIHKRIPQINWPFTLMLNCAIWSLILLIASIVIATKARYDDYHCYFWKCSTVDAATAFGFISTAGLLIQAYLHFREFRASGDKLQDVGCICIA